MEMNSVYMSFLYEFQGMCSPNSGLDTSIVNLGIYTQENFEYKFRFQ